MTNTTDPLVAVSEAARQVVVLPRQAPQTILDAPFMGPPSERAKRYSAMISLAALEEASISHHAGMREALDIAEELNLAADELNGELDRQTYDERKKLGDYSDDAEFDIVLTARQMGAFNDAIVKWQHQGKAALASLQPPQDEMWEALTKAKDLIDCIEQTSGNVWFVNADDPEAAVCTTLSDVNSALQQGGATNA